MTELREKDIAVLQAIQDGASTTAEIKDETTLTNREINYSLTEYSLEELNLVEINRETGRERQHINGHEKEIWKPKQVRLTDHGIQKLAELQAETTEYEDMSRQELIQRVHELENRLNRLEDVFKDFRSNVMDKI